MSETARPDQTAPTPGTAFDATPAPAPAPIEAVPAPAPEVVPTPEPAPEPTPAPAEPAPAAPEGPRIEPAPTDLPSLEDIGKPQETKPDGEAPPADAPKPAETVDGPVYEFKAPEGVELQPERVTEYTGILKEHGIAPEVGQKLIDMHAAAVKELAVQSVTNQFNVFNAMLKTWDDARRADPEIGGAGINTATQLAADARNRFVQTEDEKAEFDAMCKTTGCGRHPAFWRLMYRVGRALSEPTPPPDNRGPVPQPQQRNGRLGLFSDTKYPTV